MSKSSSTNYPNGFLKNSISSSVYVKDLVDLVPLKKNQVKQRSLGGYSSEVPPLPIPNREVKLTHADGTAYLGGRVGSRLFKPNPIRVRLFFCICKIAEPGIRLEEAAYAGHIYNPTKPPFDKGGLWQT